MEVDVLDVRIYVQRRLNVHNTDAPSVWVITARLIAHSLPHKSKSGHSTYDREPFLPTASGYRSPVSIPHMFVRRRTEQKKKKKKAQQNSSPLAPVVLREDRDHPLQGPQHGPVDHHRPLHLCRLAGLAALHTLREGSGRKRGRTGAWETGGRKGETGRSRKGTGVYVYVSMSDLDIHVGVSTDFSDLENYRLLIEKLTYIRYST